MKWCNKGNEEIANINNEEFEKGFFVFGAGDIGRGLALTLNKYNMFLGYIDNDVEKQKNGSNGFNVFSYDSIKEKTESIIVAATPYNTEIICKRLKEDNKKCYIASDFLNNILPVYLYFNKDILFMNLCQICVTERCTLKCEKCAHGCYNVDINSKDISISDVINTADVFFSHIDFIHEFVLIGGEPLLYKELEKAVEYIGEKYRYKMGTFSITSNGTIIPNDKLLGLSNKYDVLYRISNYTNAIPKLSVQHNKLIEKFEEYNVNYIIGKAEEEWWDYGFEEYVDTRDEIAIIEKFDQCNTPCREVRNSKLYFCVMARTVSDNLGYKIGDMDCIDLSELEYDKDGRRILLEYNLGYSDKGYLNMCRRCRGNDCSKYPVEAAKQLNRKL